MTDRNSRPSRPTHDGEVYVLATPSTRSVRGTPRSPSLPDPGVPTMVGFSIGTFVRRTCPDPEESSGDQDAQDTTAPHWTGGPGMRPPRGFEPPLDEPPHPRAPRALALVDQTYGSPPRPSWLNIRVPERISDPAPELVMLRDPHGLAAQQLRTLRYRIEREPDAQLLAIASARAGEGRSITAANLALTLAEGGRQKVLLVDAALQSPAQDRLFGVAAEGGLTTVLADLTTEEYPKVDLLAVTRTLLLLPAGPAVRSAHAALASEAAARLIGALRRTFRYIIVDSSPVLGSGETLAWHGMMDRYVLVARRGRTTVEDLGKAADRLGREKILGVSFVGATPKMLGA